MAKQETPLVTKTGKPRFFYGYVVAGAGFGIQAIAWGTFQTFGIFFKPLLAEFGWLRATISGANSLSFFVHGLVGIIAGSLNDRFGPKIIMATCGFFFGLGLLLMSQVNSIWQLYLFYGVIIGIGVSAVDVVLLSTIVRWFVKKRGIMSGVVKVGTGLGLLVMPLVASRLISAYGWRDSYIVLGILPLVSIIPLSQLLQRDPGKMGQLPDGEEQITTGSLDSAEQGLSLREAIHTRQFWVVCATYLMITFFSTTIMVHIAPHAMDIGISAANAAGIISTIGGASIAGRLVMGYASDRVGNKLALVICFLISIPALVWLQLAGELWMLYLFGAIYGFSHGGFFAIMSPVVAWLFGTRSQGAILGAVIFIGTTGGAIGPFLAGYIFDITHTYQLVFLIFVVLGITGLILTTLLRPISEGGENDTKRST